MLYPTRKESFIGLNLVKFDLKNDNFKFGAIGLFGTNRETVFYKIIANVGGKRIVVSKPDWPSVTPTIWRLQSDQEICLEAAKLALVNFSSVVYEIHKFDLVNGVVDKEFAYAVQPLITQFGGEAHLSTGQGQLPLYYGKCPEEILSGMYDPMKIIKIKMMAKQVQPVEFVQIISRVCTPTQKNSFALNWYPVCAVNMTNFAI